MTRGVSSSAARCTAVAAVLLLSVAACGGVEGGKHPAAKQSTGGLTTTPDIVPAEVTADDFDPADFGDSATVDNQWLPLRPGMQYRYQGAFTEDGERVSHSVVFTVTDLTKTLAGVRTAVAWDRDYADGELVEAELAFFAQDKDGNVWQIGQYPEEYDNGKLDKAPTWIQGLKGATAGIAMRAQPRLGSSDYAAGFAPPPIEYVDRARVYKTGQQTCVPAGCYSDVLVTEEFERTVPDAFQLKFYASGVGNVRVGWRGSKEEEKEVLVLTRVAHLGPAALARVRAGALKLEESAYRVSADVYAHTARSEPLG